MVAKNSIDISHIDKPSWTLETSTAPSTVNYLRYDVTDQPPATEPMPTQTIPLDADDKNEARGSSSSNYMQKDKNELFQAGFEGRDISSDSMLDTALNVMGIKKKHLGAAISNSMLLLMQSVSAICDILVELINNYII